MFRDRWKEACEAVAGWKIKYPTREELLGYRVLRPFARRLSSPLLWRFNRRGVARGMALGLFSAFAFPVAQMPAAALFALGARANLPVAAFATFATNPLTVPFVYYLAFRLGAYVWPVQRPALQRMEDTSWVEQLVTWCITLAGPTYLGLLIFACLSAVVGFFGVHLAWRIWVSQRWRKRGRLSRSCSMLSVPNPSS